MVWILKVIRAAPFRDMHLNFSAAETFVDSTYLC